MDALELLFESFAQSSSLFMTTIDYMRGSEDFWQYLAMVSMAVDPGGSGIYPKVLESAPRNVMAVEYFYRAFPEGASL